MTTPVTGTGAAGAHPRGERIRPATYADAGVDIAAGDRAGRVAAAEMDRTFNLGVGMVAVLARPDADRAVAILRAAGVPAWVLGEVVPGNGAVRLDGSHPR